jgi:hypothetical protein
VQLLKFIVDEMKKTVENLRKTRNSSDWTWLSKLTMSRLILFNKRRRAAVSELKVTDYTARPNWNADAYREMKMAMTEVVGMLANRYETYDLRK